MDSRYLDDFRPGERFTTAGVTMAEAAILDFAWRFDPQPFHLDAGAAAASPYGGLIASGFHTMAVTFRLFVEGGLLRDSSIGSPGIDEVRWLAPVRPGDTLHAEVEVMDVKPSASKPDRGIVRLRYHALNQRAEAVFRMDVLHLLRRRPAG